MILVTVTHLFPYKTEGFRLYLARVIMKTNYLVFVQDLPFIWCITSEKKYYYYSRCKELPNFSAASTNGKEDKEYH